VFIYNELLIIGALVEIYIYIFIVREESLFLLRIILETLVQQGCTNPEELILCSGTKYVRPISMEHPSC